MHIVSLDTARPRTAEQRSEPRPLSDLLDLALADLAGVAVTAMPPAPGGTDRAATPPPEPAARAEPRVLALRRAA